MTTTNNCVTVKYLVFIVFALIVLGRANDLDCTLILTFKISLIMACE